MNVTVSYKDGQTPTNHRGLMIAEPPGYGEIWIGEGTMVDRIASENISTITARLERNVSADDLATMLEHMIKELRR